MVNEKLTLRFRRRREKQAELAARYQWDFHVVHVASGRVSAVTIELGAQLITDGSHREATEAEVAAYHKDMKLRGEEIEAKSRQIARMNHRPDSEEVDPNARFFKFTD
jgi:hypothetical protein